MCKCSQDNPLALGEGERYLVLNTDNSGAEFFSNRDDLQKHLEAEAETQSSGYYGDVTVRTEHLEVYIVRGELIPVSGEVVTKVSLG